MDSQALPLAVPVTIIYLHFFRIIGIILIITKKGGVFYG